MERKDNITSAVFLPLACFCIVLIVGYKWPLFRWDIIAFFGLAWIIFSLFKYIIKAGRKSWLTFGSILIFILFHGLIFPGIYLCLLYYNPTSLKFDEEIYKNERSAALLDFKTVYLYNDRKRYNVLFNQLIHVDTAKQSVTLDSIEKKSQIFGSYIIKKEYRQPKGMGVPMRLKSIVIDSINGKELIVLYPKWDVYNGDVTVKKMLLSQHNKRDDLWKEALQKEARINKGYFWTFVNLYPYAINIITNGNISCVSKMANIIFFFHYIFIIVLIFTFLSSAAEESIRKLIGQ